MKPLLLPLLLASLTMAGCADPEPTRQRAPGGQAAGERLGPSDVSPTARPVTVGEGGPRFAACQGRGLVGGLRGGELAVREAPFDSAKQTGVLQDGAHVFVCTRSLDQQWLGVVIGGVPPRLVSEEPAGQAPAQPAPTIADCGVTTPARSKRAYTGPCPSGWVESTFVAAVAS